MNIKQFDFWGKQHAVPKFNAGDWVRVYDADAWEEYNGLEGEVIEVKRRGTGFLYGVRLEDDEVVEPFYAREIMKIRNGPRKGDITE